MICQAVKELLLLSESGAAPSEAPRGWDLSNCLIPADPDNPLKEIDRVVK